MYTVKEAAEKLGVSESRVRNMIGDGVLEAEKFGRSWAISEQAVERRLANKPSSGRPRKGAQAEQALLQSQQLHQPHQSRQLQPSHSASAQSQTQSQTRPPREDGLVNGAQAVIMSLEAEGVEYIFGYPGGNAIALYDALYDSEKIKHILVRHEQGAVHAADGYARATGRPGVVMVTSGPGATNTVTGIATAYMDSVPLVVITGQVETRQIGTDAFQESDTTGITLPIVKHSYLVKFASELPQTVHEAFHIASTGRPGPVLIDIPSDVANELLEFSYTLEPPVIDSYKPTYKGNARQVKQAVSLMEKADRPVLYVGGGVISSGAHEELLALAELFQIPVACTLMARGAFPADHPLYLGQPGIHGARYTNQAFEESDLIIAVGARFSDRVTGEASAFAPHAQTIHVDIDPAEIGKNREVDVPIVGDAKRVLAAMVARAKNGGVQPQTARTGEWIQTLQEWREAYPLDDEQSKKVILPEMLMHALDACVDRAVLEAGSDSGSGPGRKVIMTTEVGQHQMWACQYLRPRGPRTFLSSGGLGTMGFGFPAALGAQLAQPDALVICIAGDGSIQMNSQEMATAAAYGLPVKVVVLDNACLGMVHQMQELFYDRRFSQTELPVNPDFVKLAEAYGWKGIRVSDPARLDQALADLVDASGPALLDVKVPMEELVLPMATTDAPVVSMIDSTMRTPNIYRSQLRKGGRR